MHSTATRSASAYLSPVDNTADRGHIVHTLLKFVLEQHRWLLDIPDPFAIRAELVNLVPLIQGRTSKVMNRNSDAVLEWSLQGVQEILIWLKARQAIKIQAEPILPRIPIRHGEFLTAKSPDIEFIMGCNGQMTVTEVKNGRAAHVVQHLKLEEYGVATLLKQSLIGRPASSVQLRWIGLVYPGERGVPLDCTKLLSETKRKLTQKGADRWLREHHGVTFKHVLATLQAEPKQARPKNFTLHTV